MAVVAEVTIRELRNQGGRVIDRVEAGEILTVTRDGRPVAELRPIDRLRPTTAEVLERRRRMNLVRLDPAEVRAELDAIIDPSL